MIFKIAIITTLFAVPLATLAADKPDDFSVLSQRNMFLRDRRPPPDPWVRRPTSTQETRPFIPDPPAKSFVLRGVVIEGDELHAYVEDTRSGDITRLTPGDAVADGQISAIAIDAIAFEQNGQVRWIDIGQNLVGNAVAAPPTTSPSSTTGATTAPSDPAVSALEQRMRERRMQKQNQRTGK